MTESQPVSRRGFLGRAAAIGGGALLGSLTTTLAVSRTASAESSSDTAWQIGCYTRPWDKFDYRTAMDAIAEAGMKYVGLMTTNTEQRTVLSVKSTIDDAVRVGEEAQRRGLAIPSSWCGGINAEKRETAVAELRHLIDLCVAASAKSLLMAGTNRPEQYDNYYGAIADCCDYAADKKIGVAIKPHGPLLINGQELRKAVEKVAHKNFTIYYDAGNIMFYNDGKLDPVAEVDLVADSVSGWCIKDYRSPKNVAVTPGTGEVNFRGVLARLKKSGFHGPLLIEMLDRGDLPQLLASAKKAREFLEQLVR